MSFAALANLNFAASGSLHDEGLVGQAYYVIRVTDAEIASSAHGASG